MKLFPYALLGGILAALVIPSIGAGASPKTPTQVAAPSSSLEPVYYNINHEPGRLVAIEAGDGLQHAVIRKVFESDPWVSEDVTHVRQEHLLPDMVESGFAELTAL